ncbi:alpha-ketoglutarate-dependent dioxygenase AlkB family protein [Acinetobacter wuhouensis]|uniref:Alpha-ketoglutarate-dependent dioxygenase AlkB n=1 Tax=Acinetobacter wuhouensis TaxID=1879050 RepID=A0A3G2T6C4_9GAMM|nr:alpha-ketoglutarate-dependent dioxygenase AlkB [Acinetobacter wuhouensis]AYO55631.1 alpha-ketoglutarate-dependent dioxygenase AlkB [Acinetobacter wuhouensis]
MKLFDIEADPNKNLLPQDGAVNYYGKVLDDESAYDYFDVLFKNIEWQHDRAVIFGKTVITKRKVAWYGEQDFSYRYSGTEKRALPWTKELLELKQLVETQTSETFNSCLLNLYHSGEEGMAWHSDGETDLKKNGAIASLSFGAERRFLFKHKNTQEKVEVLLEHGSLLVMKDCTQSFWLHGLPPTKKVKTSRINLTFRTIISKQKRPHKAVF